MSYGYSRDGNNQSIGERLYMRSRCSSHLSSAWGTSLPSVSTGKSYHQKTEDGSYLISERKLYTKKKPIIFNSFWKNE